MNEEILKETLLDNEHLATRWQRLWASLIDSLTLMIVTLPIMYFTGVFDIVVEGGQPTALYTLLLSLAGITFFVLINYKLLVTNGQTIGKKFLDIKIVDLNEELPTGKNLMIRYAIYFGLGQVPIIGQILSIVNVLFIFGQEKRCGHDYIAKTKVIRADM